MPQRFIAAVDLGASNVRVAIANPDGEIEARRPSRTRAAPPNRCSTASAGRSTTWCAASGLALAWRRSASSSPGSVDPAAGTVDTAANLPGWGAVPIAALLGVPRGVPVVAENDANAAAVGERWMGAAKGLRDIVFVALGTGIGAGVVLHGKLRRGAHFLAGEVAFFRMTREQLHKHDWEHCLEGVAGGRAFEAKARELLGVDAKVSDLFDAAYAGDERAGAWLRETQDYLAMATVTIGALLDPQAIVFGGGVMAAQGERLLGPLREAALRSLPAHGRSCSQTLGEDAQVLGAVRLALDRLEGVHHDVAADARRLLHVASRSPCARARTVPGDASAPSSCATAAS